MQHDFLARPLTPERWGDFETVFGPQGACYGCWCTAFKIPAFVRTVMEDEEKKEFMRARVEAGPPPGLIGYLGEVPFAWVQACPRAELPQWNSERTVSRPLDPADAVNPRLWSVSCFFTVSKYRGKGFSHRMLEAAIDFARDNGAEILEACPMDQAKRAKSIGLFVGSTRVFAAAGFSEIARRKDGRPLMRLELFST